MDLIARIAITAAAAFIGQVADAKPVSHSCSYISLNAFEGKATCSFIDAEHKSVIITPFKRVSANSAAKWIVSASAFLHLAGERSFTSITVLGSPDEPSFSVEAKANGSFHFQDDEKTILANTVVCKLASDWSDVIGPGESAAKPRKCKPIGK